MSVSPSPWFSLRPNESVLRVDDVDVRREAATGLWPKDQRIVQIVRRAKLFVTNQRLIFAPPTDGPLLGFLFLAWYALGEVASFELTEIEAFHTWKPAFSGPPMFQIGTDGWSFVLIRGRIIGRRETKDRMRQHFEVIEKAWRAAKAGLEAARV